MVYNSFICLPLSGSAVSNTFWYREDLSVFKNWGTSLLVQGLRIHFVMQGTWVWSLVREPGSHMTWNKRMLSCFSCVQFFETLWTIALQAPLSMGSPGKNTGVDCHALLQGIFLIGIKPTSLVSPALAHSSPPGKISLTYKGFLIMWDVISSVAK